MAVTEQNVKPFGGAATPVINAILLWYCHFNAENKTYIIIAFLIALNIKRRVLHYFTIVKHISHRFSSFWFDAAHFCYLPIIINALFNVNCYSNWEHFSGCQPCLSMSSS